MSVDKKKSFEFTANMRSTRMGEYHNTRLFSLKQKRELAPHQQMSSKTENHGSKTWFLLPGKYICWSANYSNSGNGSEGIKFLIVNIDGSFSYELCNEIIDWIPLNLQEVIQPYE